MYKIIAGLLLMLNQSSAAYLESDHKIKSLEHLRYLDDLLASGSEQFSDGQFALLLNEIVQRHNVHPSKIVIIDLREETHFFADGIPFTATDRHEDPSKDYTFPNESKIQKNLIAEKIIKLEPRKLDVEKHERWKKLKGSLKNTMHKKHRNAPNKPVQLNDPIIKTEAEICKNYGVQYWRMPITDHYPPEQAAIQEFIKFVSTLPQDTWIHIHCRNGNGRTTTFLAILEMMRFKNHSLYDVLTRQKQIGGKDLLKMSEEIENQQVVRNRLNVVKSTYDNIHS
ncbi:MAG: protein-tyrosine phosphatase family protein [Pseudomonadota bacterium]